MYHHLCIYIPKNLIYCLLITTLFYFILLIRNYKTWNRNLSAQSLWNASSCAYIGKFLEYLLMLVQLHFTTVTDKIHFLVIFFTNIIFIRVKTCYLDEVYFWEDVSWFINAGVFLYWTKPTSGYVVHIGWLV